MFATQKQALWTKFFQAKIEKGNVDPECIICCSKEVKLVSLLASGCRLAQIEH